MTSSAPVSDSAMPPPTLRWEGDWRGRLILLDQTKLPTTTVEYVCANVEDVWEAIKSLRVRGAPAIGIAAAYGVVLGAQQAAEASCEDFLKAVRQAAEYLATSRPTAVNLFWALDRMNRVLDRNAESADSEAISSALLREAQKIHEEDRQMCRAIGLHGAPLLTGGGVLTHCNAGGLATADYGTALAVIFAAHEQGLPVEVYVDETRPLLQGSRLTAWELQARGIPATLICDSMAGLVMREQRVQAVITGADRIAANGDTANKIGTYSVATLARAHDIPFYVAAPSSTFDMSLATGAEIPIEERAAEEITEGFGRRTAPAGIDVYNPAFDVTPANLISAIITEQGVIRPVNAETIAAVLTQES